MRCFIFNHSTDANVYFWLRENNPEFCDEVKDRASTEEKTNPTTSPELEDGEHICSRIAAGVEEFLNEENPLDGDEDGDNLFADIVTGWLKHLDYQQIAKAIVLGVEAPMSKPERSEVV